ncbi:hypothetical protein [Saccharomonospora xinjiangensis]|uniref:hypothetical protein n=1 Tax=Saccharomonospora xinjiangensis TaxID=75294 RepID=UPI001FFCBBEA|nr:hypothetical protein [Saccharomonospora xinjiangensis]
MLEQAESERARLLVGPGVKEWHHLGRMHTPQRHFDERGQVGVVRHAQLQPRCPEPESEHGEVFDQHHRIVARPSS